MEIFHILTHSIELYNLEPMSFSTYDAYIHAYSRVAQEFGHLSYVGYLSLSTKGKLTLTHKYGHQILAYPVTFNRGRFGYEISKKLIEDTIKCDADIIHVHSYYPLMYDCIALVKKLNGKPLVAHYHGGEPSTLPYPLKVLKKLTLVLADKVISINKAEVQRLQEYWRVPAEKIVYMPNGVDTVLFRPLNSVKKEDRAILFVGNLVKGKGLELLISAFTRCKQELKDLKLWVVGNGYMRRKLEEKVKNQGVSRDIKFFGRVNHKQLVGFYNKATVTVLPSEKEGFPLVLVESMACGTPVIATVNDGSKDIITNGFDGLLVPQNNVNALSKAIFKLVSDRNLRRKMGDNARRKAVGQFSWEKIGNLLNDLYTSL